MSKMALDDFPRLSNQYGLFLDRSTLNSFYGAFSLARAFGDEARGREVVERLIHDKVQSGNYGLADRITSISANFGIRSIFEAADTYERFMRLAEHGELPTIQASEPKEQPIQYRKWSYFGWQEMVAAALLMAVGLWSLFATSNSPRVSYTPDKVPATAAYPNTPTEKFIALQKAGWLYYKDGFFGYIVTDRDTGGISQILIDTNQNLGAKEPIDARLAGVLANEIVHTKGSQVRNRGRKGNWADLKNPKKNRIRVGDILRAPSFVLQDLFKD